MSYQYNINYLFVISDKGMIGGDEDIYKAIPMITGMPTVLIGQGYLILNAELESVGMIFACVVEDTEEHNDNPPSS